MPLIELGIGDQWEKEDSWQILCEASAIAGIESSPYSSLLKPQDAVEISIKLSDNDEVQQLNKVYRGKDKTTNVLSFPQLERDFIESFTDGDTRELLLGDIILARTTCEKEAKEKEISLTDHVSHLIVHGTLHLLGYDHQDEVEAKTMEQLEIQALLSLGIANPYNDMH